MEKVPLSSIWNTGGPTIQFINKGDFEMEDLLERLGLTRSKLAKSFGSVDREEIVSRQELVRLLWEDQRLLDWCADYRKLIPDASLLMTDPDTFLRDFNPELPSTPYISSVRRTKSMFKRAMGASDNRLKGKLKIFLDYLDKTLGDMNSVERKYASAIYPELEQQARYHGMIRYQFKMMRDYDLSLIESEAVGWRQYSYRLSSDYKVFSFPKKKFWNVVTKALGYTIGLPVTLLLHWRNYMMEKRKFAPFLQTDLPKEMKEDVGSHVKQLVYSLVKRYYSDGLDTDREGTHLHGKTVDMWFGVNYGDEGLKIRLIDHSVQIVKESPRTLYNDVGEFFGKYGSTGQYTGEFRAKVDTLNFAMTNRFNRRLFNLSLQKLLTGIIQGHQPELLSTEGVSIGDGYSKKMLRKEALAVIMDVRPDIAEMHEEMVEYREDIEAVLKNINEVAALVVSMKRAAKSIGKPVCFPEIFNDDEHLVEFKKLYPIHLIGRTNNVGKTLTGRQLVPINQLIPINGQMVALTGQNAGGKTATKVELVNAIFLAQSGLPVFAESFGLNPKRIIGMVFVERGAGSLLQLLMQKTKNILEAIEGQHENHIFVVIDELLTGTQEASGFAIGKKILAKLAGSGASVIFSTQITGLAEYAVDNLNARAFAFDIHHNVKPGIASGNPELLMEELGMKELL